MKIRLVALTGLAISFAVPAFAQQKERVVRQPVRQTVHFQTSAPETGTHYRSLEKVIQDQHDWYQMNDG
jgi:hypothetical protein